MNTQIRQIAQRLRGLRDALELTVAQAAMKTGIPEADIIRYESGESDIPISFISQVSQTFDVEITALISGNEPHVKTYYITRNNTGARVERTTAYKYLSLAAGFQNAEMEPFEVTVEPSEQPVTQNTHPGQEFDYVLEGSVQLNIGDTILVLNEGDSIYFDASMPHGMKALGARYVKFLAIILPTKRQ